MQQNDNKFLSGEDSSRVQFSDSDSLEGIGSAEFRVSEFEKSRRELSAGNSSDTDPEGGMQINETYWILFLCILGTILLIALGVLVVFYCKLQKQNAERERRQNLNRGVEEGKIQVMKVEQQQKNTKTKWGCCPCFKKKKAVKRAGFQQELEHDPHIVGMEMQGGVLRFVQPKRQLRLNSLKLHNLEVQPSYDVSNSQLATYSITPTPKIIKHHHLQQPHRRTEQNPHHKPQIQKNNLMADGSGVQMRKGGYSMVLSNPPASYRREHSPVSNYDKQQKGMDFNKRNDNLEQWKQNPTRSPARSVNYYQQQQTTQNMETIQSSPTYTQTSQIQQQQDPPSPSRHVQMVPEKNVPHQNRQNLKAGFPASSASDAENMNWIKSKDRSRVYQYDNRDGENGGGSATHKPSIPYTSNSKRKESIRNQKRQKDSSSQFQLNRIQMDGHHEGQQQTIQDSVPQRFTVKQAPATKMAPRLQQKEPSISCMDAESKSQISNLEANLENLMYKLQQKKIMSPDVRYSNGVILSDMDHQSPATAHMMDDGPRTSIDQRRQVKAARMTPVQQHSQQNQEEYQNDDDTFSLKKSKYTAEEQHTTPNRGRRNIAENSIGGGSTTRRGFMVDDNNNDNSNRHRSTNRASSLFEIRQSNVQ